MEVYKNGKTSEGKIFLLRSGLELYIKADVLQFVPEAAGAAIYLDPTRISSHSSRIGGALALAAAGVPDYLIMDMGRWRSLTFLTYVRRSTQMFNSAKCISTARSVDGRPDQINESTSNNGGN